MNAEQIHCINSQIVEQKTVANVKRNNFQPFRVL